MRFRILAGFLMGLASLAWTEGSWGPVNQQSILKTSGEEVMVSGPQGIVGMKRTVSGRAVTAKTVLSFEWRAEGEGISYTAFQVSVRGEKRPFFLWSGDRNAFVRPEAAVWHRVCVPLLQLKTLPKEPLTDGKVPVEFTAFQSGKGSQRLSMRNFSLKEVAAENRAAAKGAVPGIRIWPRRDSIHLPGNLEQFIFVELENFSCRGAFDLSFELPEGMTVTGFPKADGWATLPPGRLYPKTWSQRGRKAVFSFAPGAAQKLESHWLTLMVKVESRPGVHQLSVAAPWGRQSFPVHVHGPLADVQGLRSMLKVWQYSGLEQPFAATYVAMLRKAGINTFCHMQSIEERPGISDEVIRQGGKLGLAYFLKKIHVVERHAAKEFPGVRWTETWLLEHPSVFKRQFKRYLQLARGGRPLDFVVYDAESGSWRPEKKQVLGDLSDYSLKVFGKYAGIAEGTVLNHDVILQTYPREWMRFRCHQSNQCAALIREFLDEEMPQVKLYVYSGYEYDQAPFKDRTRQFYSVDWKTMADCGMDGAGTGYYGSMEQIRHTAAVLKGRAPLAPAEMYLENFLTKKSLKSPVEAWTMRLIEAYVAGGMEGGLSIWYGNILDGSALIAINGAAAFMKLVEPYAFKGRIVQDAVTVSPEHEGENVQVLQDGGNLLLMVLNGSPEGKRLRIRLNHVTLAGYTGEAQICDLSTGEKLKPRRVLTVNLKPYSYRLIHVLDDGN